MADVFPEWRVAALAELPDPGALEFKVGEKDWPFRGIVVRWQGAVYAYANVCPHAGHPLNLQPTGFLNGDKSLLVCSSHGALFEPADGACVAGPCAGQVLTALDCRVADGAIYARAPASQRTPL